ncbi:(Lyso)-N-acylphosphatidylethanolamine lipase isoform X4 [Physeter macrocephalus]|uniref:(Lyso)-N-acylphosphatidylethanolamine lipase isoform X4 n=1 Tax=Physeter macrocephalus TaxID=9755 RepID=A0A455BUD7_PHYMC|nr:(Lyso)-N-acylphosphatidylethanolamine lipase isoform X4 [Physeter catodon]|eukprot:XP_028351408.1 protein ABHD4 isoform X3 [Physeter catodon]
MGWLSSTRQGLFTMADDLEQQPQGWLSSWLPTWRPTSMSQLKNVEARILQCLQNKFLARYVSLPNQNKIWTVTVSPELRDRTPLVMVHGFGGGVGLWILNMDSLSTRRTLHTFDLLGFGRSSRPTFPRDPEGAEDEFVTSIETWRETMGIPSMILLGHSLGGFLATSYSIKYPDRVKHLILVDPWGFPLRPTDPSQIRAPPTWVKAVASVLGRSNPLAVLRVAGPWAWSPLLDPIPAAHPARVARRGQDQSLQPSPQWQASSCPSQTPRLHHLVAVSKSWPSLVQRFRPDFKRKFADFFDDDTISEYIYHCNAQNPSGETAFKTMMESFGWARRPMLERIHLIQKEMPITMIYGANTWIDTSTGKKVKLQRPDSYVRDMEVTGSGTHSSTERSRDLLGPHPSLQSNWAIY